uniref:Uncharacterized protein n=1 Tax=Klebsiella phage vB_KpnM_Iguana_ER37 TaxID=3076781 RepID=A0AB38Z4I9_9CAUD
MVLNGICHEPLDTASHKQVYSEIDGIPAGNV